MLKILIPQNKSILTCKEISHMVTETHKKKEKKKATILILLCQWWNRNPLKLGLYLVNLSIDKYRLD